jgi:hypothetical protein
LKLKYLEIYRV